MRGLTDLEHDVLLNCLEPDPTPDSVDEGPAGKARPAFERALERLKRRGLVAPRVVRGTVWTCDVHDLTEAGLLVLRIHEALCAGRVP